MYVYIYIHVYIYVYFALCRLPYRVARPNMSVLVFSCTVRSTSQKVSRRDCGWPDLISASKMNLSPSTRHCVSQDLTSETTVTTAYVHGTICRPKRLEKPCHSIKRHTVVYTTVLERLSRPFAELQPTVDTPEAVHLICHTGGNAVQHKAVPIALSATLLCT